MPLLLTLGLGAAGAAALHADAVSDSLVQTERAFARASVEKGMKEAFLAYLGEDAVIFRPTAVPGVAWIRDHPNPPIVLTWQPAYAEVSAAGDLGFTTGPYEIRSQDPKDTDVGYGTFVTVWKRQPDGGFKVAVDLGTSGPKPGAAEAVGSTAPVEQVTLSGEPKAVAYEDLLAVDRALSTAAAQGTPAAYHAHLADGVRLLRRGAPVAHGPEAAEAELRRHPGALTWQPAGGGIARSGDLGYTYGTAKMAGAKPEESSYLRIWQRGAGSAWKVILEVTDPLPAPKPH
jgi:ketosteroid isomerase-like protein